MGEQFDRVCSLDNMALAYKRAFRKRSRPGPDDISWLDIDTNREGYILELQNQLLSGEFTPSIPAIETKIYPYGSINKTITYNVLNVRERLVEYAIKEVLSSLYEEVFLPFSCAYRKGKDEKLLMQLVGNALSEGYIYFTSVDIKSFFSSIDRKILKEEILDFTKDEKLVTLIERCLFFEDGKTGIMPGHVLSPLLSNIFLHPVDLELKGIRVIRYGDNYIFPQTDTKKWLEKAGIVSCLLQKRNLQLNQAKTKLLIEPNPKNILLD